jgi:membrane protein DedA with SNARE-associated domain
MRAAESATICSTSATIARFFIFNALGGSAWATIFGLGGFLLGASIHRIAGPVGWVMLVLALAAAVGLWRYFKHHEDALLVKAERERATYEGR